MEINKYYGYCSWELEDKDLNDPYVHIHGLHIYPQYRQQGKAREILQIAIDEIRSIGWEGDIDIVARPTSDIPKEKLKSFYESMGLKVYEYYG